MLRSVVLALLERRAIHDARTQHYSDAALDKARQWPSLLGADLLASMPPRLRIGVSLE